MDIEVQEQEVIIPLGPFEDDNDDDYDHLGTVCDTHGIVNVNDGFDPEELERDWERERQNVDDFHQETSFYANQPPIQPRQLFND